MRDGHAERVEEDIDGGAVVHEGHVLFGHDARDDALVAVTPGELVADGQRDAWSRGTP